MKKILLIPLCVDIRTIFGFAGEIIFYAPNPFLLNGSFITHFEFADTSPDDDYTDVDREINFRNLLNECSFDFISIITPVSNFHKTRELICETFGEYEIQEIKLPVQTSELVGNLYIMLPEGETAQAYDLTDHIMTVVSLAHSYVSIFNKVPES